MMFELHLDRPVLKCTPLLRCPRIGRFNVRPLKFTLYIYAFCILVAARTPEPCMTALHLFA